MTGTSQSSSSCALITVSIPSIFFITAGGDSEWETSGYTFIVNLGQRYLKKSTEVTIIKLLQKHLPGNNLYNITLDYSFWPTQVHRRVEEGKCFVNSTSSLRFCHIPDLIGVVENLTSLVERNRSLLIFLDYLRSLYMYDKTI